METDTDIRTSQIDRARHPWEHFRFGGGMSVREGSTGHEALLVFVSRNPVYVSLGEVKDCRIEPKRLFFIPPETAYRIEGRGTAKVVTCLFDPAFFKSYGYDFPRPDRRRSRSKKGVHCVEITDGISRMEGLAEVYLGMEEHFSRPTGAVPPDGLRRNHRSTPRRRTRPVTAPTTTKPKL